MKLLIWLLILCLVGCTAQADYTKARINAEIIEAGNLCLDHGGIIHYRFRVTDGYNSVGPIRGVMCMDEKYFDVPDYFELSKTK
jgi:hypothetical protein